jgi:hypothetical protein
MVRVQFNVRLEEDVADMVRRLSEESVKRFGVKLTYAQVVEMAVRHLAKEEK